LPTDSFDTVSFMNVYYINVWMYYKLFSIGLGFKTLKSFDC
jgi:hypothetical protein